MFCVCGRKAKPSDGRRCWKCSDRTRDPFRARLRRRAYKARLRRQQGCVPMVVRKAQGEINRAHTQALNEDARRSRPPRQRKPWHGLPPSQAFVVRYACDEEFRAGEVLRAQLRKAKVSAVSDGTVTKRVLGRLYHQATHCWYCKRRFYDHLQKSVDHVVPIAKGGRHTLSNLVIACMRCNKSKNSRLLGDWAAPAAVQSESLW